MVLIGSGAVETGGARIELPPVEAPLVTVIMVTYGAQEWVAQAIDALATRTPPVYELVAVDNASPDGTGDWLANHVRGLNLVRNTRNLGFGAAANQGALEARAPLLFFLNSDAMVEDRWLEPLVETVETIPNVGAVVPNFRNLDGTLQEAGCAVFRDGLTFQIGYGDDPDKPEYRFRRFVTYGSGAGLMLRRAEFLAVGGFDPRYEMGYCEDVDLCFEFAQQGLRTVYEPRSRIRHVRRASMAPRDVFNLRGERFLPEATYHQNTGIFKRRWGTTLGRHPDSGDISAYPHRVIAARDVDAMDRILVIGDRLPPDMDAPVTRLAARMIALCPRSRVTVMGFDQVAAAEHLSPLLEAGVELVWGVSSWEEWFNLRLAHYSVAVCVTGSAAARADVHLRATQPQALRVYYLDPATTGDHEGLADMLPRFDAVWYGSKEPEESTERAASSLPQFVVAEREPASGQATDGPGSGLRRALAALGIAPRA